MKIISLAVLSLLFGTAADAASGQPLKVQDESFVVSTTEADGSFTERETTTVMLVPDGVCYAWMLKFSPQNRAITLTEHFKLPAPPARWGGIDGEPNASQRLKNGRRVAETPITLDPVSGIATNGWCVAEGDPIGAYRIDILHQGKRIHRFDFTVVKPE